MAAVDITPTQDGGVLKEIITPGVGDNTPPNGSSVKAHYHGTLEDGTVFDSSVERNQPFSFDLGKGSVIKAWDLGVATMKKGEKAKFTCKAEYAYGARGSPPTIPPGATLIFEITLLSWKEEDLTEAKDGGIRRGILKQGEGFAQPADFCLCKVNIKGTHAGRVFDERELSFNIGEGEDLNIPPGLQQAIKAMKTGEQSRITLKPKYGWPSGNKQFDIPENATIQYEVTLIEFEKDKEAWDMDAGDKLKEAELFKSKATEYFKSSKFPTAIKLYNKAEEYINDSTGYSEAEEVERKKARLAILLNLGLCHLKLNEFYEAKTQCDKALEIDPNNVKGLFRRGQAYLAISEPEKALIDFEQAIKIEPTNNAAISQINVCRAKIREIRDKEKKIYTNMFAKFAKKDQEVA